MAHFITKKSRKGNPWKNIIAYCILLVLVVGLVVTLYQVQQQQEERSRAEAARHARIIPQLHR